MNTAVIEVRIWNQRVGAVTLDPEYGYYAVGYDDAWRKKGIELAPFAMPTSSSEVAFEFRSLPEPTFHRLPALSQMLSPMRLVTPSLTRGWHAKA